MSNTFFPQLSSPYKHLKKVNNKFLKHILKNCVAHSSTSLLKKIIKNLAVAQIPDLYGAVGNS